MLMMLMIMPDRDAQNKNKIVTPASQSKILAKIRLVSHRQQRQWRHSCQNRKAKKLKCEKSKNT